MRRPWPIRGCCVTGGNFLHGYLSDIASMQSNFKLRKNYRSTRVMYVSPEARIMIRPLYCLRKNLGCPMHVKLDETQNV